MVETVSPPQVPCEPPAAADSFCRRNSAGWVLIFRFGSLLQEIFRRQSPPSYPARSAARIIPACSCSQIRFSRGCPRSICLVLSPQLFIVTEHCSFFQNVRLARSDPFSGSPASYGLLLSFRQIPFLPTYPVLANLSSNHLMLKLGNCCSFPALLIFIGSFQRLGSRM